MSDGGDIDRFIRSHLVSFSGYSSRVSAETLEGDFDIPAESFIKLDANENLYGCSPRVGWALAACPDLNIYPDAAQTELKSLLAGYTGAPAENIVAGSGSGDLIDLLLRLLLEPGDEVIVPVPAFTMFRFSSRMYDARIVEIPREDGFSVSVDTVKGAITGRTKIIMLDNPNNPTGNLTPREDIVKLLDTGLPVLIDEAYGEFSGETVVPLMGRYPNLMVLRTFSKWAALAGLRVGYGIFPPEIARFLMTIKLPYNVNAAAVIAVRESLKDLDYLMDNVKAIIKEKDRLYKGLKETKSLTPFPSRANFVFCAVRDGRANELHRRLRGKGIMVRYFDTPYLKDAIRVSVGKPEHTDALITALREIEEETNG